MANIKLKDASGKEVSYNDVDKIIVPSTSGGTTEFLAGGGTISIAENGNYDVTRYAEANVNVTPSTETKTVNLSMASGNQTISATSGKYMTSVTVNKPSTLIADNIKKDVNIGGVVGTLESGEYNIIQTIDGDTSSLAIRDASPFLLQSKTVTANGNVTPDSGYDGLSMVIVNVPTSKPVLDTLSVTQNGTYMPPSGTDGYSKVTVAVSGGEGDAFVPAAWISNRETITEISHPTLSRIGSSAFYYCSRLTTASFPQCSYIGSYAFYFCSSLTTTSFPQCAYIGTGAFHGCYFLRTASFPQCSYIGNNAFQAGYNLTTASFPQCSYIGNNAFVFCSNLTTASFPQCSYIGDTAFRYCSSLTTASFPQCSYIGSYAFAECVRLSSLYLMTNSICSLINSNAFSSTPIGGYTTRTGRYGSIYVPASLLASYKTATNWAYFSSRMVGI